LIVTQKVGDLNLFEFPISNYSFEASSLIIMFNQDKPNDRSKLEKRDQTASSAIARIKPEVPPTLIEEWVIWEYDTLVHTNGINFETEDLHDLLKQEVERQGIPVDVFLSYDARWRALWAKFHHAIDDDARKRVVLKLKPDDSPYTDIQFIAGIDYFGDSDWANIQMMIVMQPEKIPLPSRPSRPTKKNVQPLLPIGAIIAMAAVAFMLYFAGLSGRNEAVIFLGVIGSIATLGLSFYSYKDVYSAKAEYALANQRYDAVCDKWREEKVEIELEEAELKRRKLFRSFKRDDLRVFHSVAIGLTTKIITTEIFDKGAEIGEVSEDQDESKTIPSMKDKLFDKAARFEG
jgi:hypothetical protein